MYNNKSLLTFVITVVSASGLQANSDTEAQLRSAIQMGCLLPGEIFTGRLASEPVDNFEEAVSFEGMGLQEITDKDILILAKRYPKMKKLSFDFFKVLVDIK